MLHEIILKFVYVVFVYVYFVASYVLPCLLCGSYSVSVYDVSARTVGRAQFKCKKQPPFDNLVRFSLKMAIQMPKHFAVD